MPSKNTNSEENLLKNNSKVEDEDFVLIRAFQQGDESAFSKLVLKHKDKVRNLVYLTIGDTDYLDDISQDVFISTFHKLSDFRFESKFSTWLYRVTVNKCRDYLRKKKVRQIFTPLQEEIHQRGSRMHTESIDIPGFVQKAISKLPDKLRIPLIMRDIDGLTYKEIAEKLETEVGTVKSRIFRARESLKIILEPMEKELRH